jgi:hypothetical protein
MTINRVIPQVAAIAVAISTALAAVPAAAADPANPKFQALDKNNDGFITRDEVTGTRW